VTSRLQFTATEGCPDTFDQIVYLRMCEVGSLKAVFVSKETCQSPLCYSFSRISELDISGMSHSHIDFVCFQWLLFFNCVVEWITVLCIWQAQVQVLVQRSGILSEICCSFP
jgi:hypothetical protein